MKKAKIVLTCSTMLTEDFLKYLKENFDLVTAGCSISEYATIELLQEADLMLMGGNEIITPDIHANIPKKVKFIFIGIEARTSFPGTWEKMKGRVFATGGGQGTVVMRTMKQLTRWNPGRLHDICVSTRLPEIDAETKVGSQTLLVIGAGSIGRQVMEKAQKIFMDVIYSGGRGEKQELRDRGFQYVSDLGEAISRADAVSIHLELNPQTERTIRLEHLSRMPQKGFLLNNARAGLIPAEDLLVFLSERPDVFVIFDEFYVNGRQFDYVMKNKRRMGKKNRIYRLIMKLNNFLYTKHTASHGKIATREYSEGARLVLKKLGYIN